MVWGTNLVNILPAEILIHIGGSITSTHDLAHFILVNRRTFYLLNKLLYKRGVEAPDPNFPNKLFRVISQNQYNALKMFFEAGFQVNSYRIFRWWPLLQVAVKLGRIEMLKLMLANGADVNHSGERILAPLMYANSPQMLEVLLKAGGNPNIKGTVSETLLKDWVIFAAPDMVRLLLEYGADAERVPN